MANQRSADPVQKQKLAVLSAQLRRPGERAGRLHGTRKSRGSWRKIEKAHDKIHRPRPREAHSQT